ncbi:uncharacterized protein TRUGW13939_04950 [Talaromyces rugulosus]|uniref:Major facilitator superfamily (MFS) profile domain-containing protein n=1 Tax=Talaromyces rugulosus TaxID=121627 RepID=A0A7H8QUZ6_TALRU|nr:uncharacterized protein TRUGW13939_04950 [Talaromyces rugulosus]QKX57830.1 hypothetical protein TRUGW13939_04950 [Talaromyces rugulosus]
MNDEKPGTPAAAVVDDQAINERYADETLRFVEQYGDAVDRLGPQEERRLVWKLHWRIMLLLSVTNLLLFIDKATLSYASLLGIFEETGLTQSEYNNLNTIFYVGYIVAQLPGHYLMQRLPLGKFVGGAIFFWSLLIFLHDTAHNYGGFIPLRFFLGVVESCVVPAMEMTMGMFFIPKEQAALQPIFWISCLGSGIPAGFISYGLLFTKSTIRPWKFFMILTGGLSLFLSIYCWFFYPSNPVDAKFLTPQEKIHVIRRVQESTKSSIEQKQFKKSQFTETIKDPISWLFLLQVFTLMLSNSLTYQQTLLFLAIGVSDLGSTLVSVAGAGFAVACAVVAYFLLRWFPNKNAWWALFWMLPAIAGGIGMVAVDWNKKIGLLACLTLAANTWGISYIIALGWTSSSAAGYTKKLLRNVLFMAGYGIANIISPQIWVEKDGPRFYGAWIAQIVISWAFSPLILFVIRWILVRRNKERRAWIAEQEAQGKSPVGFVEQIDDDGQVVKVQVDISQLDLTDLENKYFIYPL